MFFQVAELKKASFFLWALHEASALTLKNASDALKKIAFKECKIHRDVVDRVVLRKRINDTGSRIIS